MEDVDYFAHQIVNGLDDEDEEINRETFDSSGEYRSFGFAADEPQILGL